MGKVLLIFLGLVLSTQCAIIENNDICLLRERSGTTCFSSGKCLGQPDGTIFTDPRTTTGFIECLCGCEEMKACVPGTSYNETLKLCVQKIEIEHCKNCVPCDNNCLNPGKCSGQPDGTVFANPKTIAGFIECKCGCEEEKSCVAGAVFYESIRSCVHVHETTHIDDCNSSGQQCENPGKCAGQSDGTVFADPKTIAGFIECKCGCEEEKSCVAGAVFYESIRSCVHVHETTHIDDCNSSGQQCENPGKCSGQPDGTVFADPKTIAGFIECKCGCEEEKSCVAGAVFYESIRSCVHVNETTHIDDCNSSGQQCENPGKCSGQPDGTVFADPKTIAGFIECKCGCEEEKSCVAGAVFYESIRSCVHVHETTHIDDCNSSGQQCENPGKCAGQSDGTVFADPKTIAGFIECNCGCEEEKSCVAGAVFYESIRSCVHVHETTHIDDCNSSGQQCENPGKCSGQPDGTVFADPKTIAGFIECKCGCEEEKSCVAGAVFYESIRSCVHVHETTHIDDCNASGQQCENLPDGTILADPKTKTGYIECKSGCEQQKLCAPETVFNDAWKFCVQVNQTGHDDNCNSQCKNPGKCAGQPDGTILTDPKTKTGYIECKCGCEQQKPCALETIFNKNLKSCVHVKEIGNCGNCDGCGDKCNNPGKCAGQPDRTIFANPNAKNGYIECEFGCEVNKPCLPGTVFNAVYKFCVHTIGNIKGNTGNCESSDVKCSNSGICAGRADGTILPNPNTTTGYILCKCGCEQTKSCVPGTRFNDEIKMCVHMSEGRPGCGCHKQ